MRDDEWVQIRARWLAGVDDPEQDWDLWLDHHQERIRSICELAQALSAPTMPSIGDGRSVALDGSDPVNVLLGCLTLVAKAVFNLGPATRQDEAAVLHVLDRLHQLSDQRALPG